MKGLTAIQNKDGQEDQDKFFFSLALRTASKFLDLGALFYIQNGFIEKISLQFEKTKKISIAKHSIHIQIIQWAVAYAQSRQAPPLPLNLEKLSPFSRFVLNETMKIPFGKTLNYQDLASQIKNPLAARAVGNALSKNPFPLVIPCHRVLPKGKKSCGNYFYGKDVKRALLDFENQSSSDIHSSPSSPELKFS